VREFLCVINGGAAYFRVAGRDEYDAQKRAAMLAYRTHGTMVGKCEVFRPAAPVFHFRLTLDVEPDPNHGVTPEEDAFEVDTGEVVAEEPR